MGLQIRGNDGWHPDDYGYLLIAKNICKTMLEIKLFEAEPFKIFSLEKIIDKNKYYIKIL